jgi:hypothetical protein
MIRAYLESEKTCTWACAVDLPGWQRRGKGPEAALEALEAYRDRYAEATGDRPTGELQVVGMSRWRSTPSAPMAPAIGRPSPRRYPISGRQVRATTS